MRTPSKTWNRNNLLLFPNKVLRTQALVRYILDSGYKGIVVFTCGNSAKELRNRFQGIPGYYVPGALPTIIEVGPRGQLGANQWWSPEEIHASWPDFFDATSGHLPMPLMVRVADEFRSYMRHSPLWRLKFDEQGGQWFVPTGSGETIICLRMAFPNVDFCAVYDNEKPETTRDQHAPLNSVVDALFPVEYWNGKL